MNKTNNPFKLMEKLIKLKGKDSVNYIIEFYLKEALDFSLKYIKDVDGLTDEQFNKISKNIWNNYKQYLDISTKELKKIIKKIK